MLDNAINDKIMELLKPLEMKAQWEYLAMIVISYCGHYEPQGRIDYYKHDLKRFLEVFEIKYTDEDIFNMEQLREMFGNRLDIWTAVKLSLGKFLGAQEDHSEGDVYTREQISALRALSISVAWE
jgi:hypothetical protein